MTVAVVCTRAPGKFLAKVRAGNTWTEPRKKGAFLTMKLALGPPTRADAIPASLRARAVAVLRATGPIQQVSQPNGARFFRWLEDLARAAEGAVLVDRAIVFIDPIALVRDRFEKLASELKFSAIATWLQKAAVVAAREEEAHALFTLARALVLEHELTIRIAPLLEVLWAESFDPAVAEMIVALAREPVAHKRASLQALATKILDDRQATLDRTVGAPTTVDQLRAIYEAKDPRTVKRLRARIPDWELGDLLIELAASGWAPSVKIRNQIAADLQIDEIQDESVLARLASDEFAAHGPIAKVIQTLATAYQGTFANQATEETAERFAEYERYRADPDVVTPRPYDMDLALFRRLNTALYGVKRNRPMLPERFVVMICDRRFADAYTAYREQFLVNRETAETAIRDAIDYFAAGADFTLPA